MPGSRDQDDADGGDDPPKLSIMDRLRLTFLKSADPSEISPESEKKSVEQLEEEAKSANDKERMIGLIAAPLAAVVGVIITNADVSTALAKGVNPTVYRDLTLVLLAMALLMLAAAWFRKRLFLGMVLALYGLAVFNLHYWGFGVPFLLAGAWYLVRAYRIQRDLKEAGGGGAVSGPSATGGSTGGSKPKPNKRYTPPTAPKRSSPPDQDKGQPDKGQKAS